MSNKQRIIALLKCIPALLLLVMIFNFSSATSEESTEESNAITKAFVEITNIRIDDATLSAIDDVVRELAHFTEYFMLGITCCLVLSSFSIVMRIRNIGLCTFCVLYAVSDEIHQYFVPGRCFQLQDILVDSIGAITAILIWWLCERKRLVSH